VRMPQSQLSPQGVVLGYRGPRRTILVVDDQAVQRALLADMLGPLGFAVFEADGGAACLQAVPELAPDLILMDVSMPGMDGWTVCARLHERGSAVPVIMVSANAGGGPPREDCPPPAAFVMKPVMLNELLSRIGHCLDIEWVMQPAGTRAADPPPAGFADMALAREDAEILLELGAMGYVKGVLAKLDDIRARTPQVAPLLDHLRTLAADFRLKEYNSLLKSHVRSATSPP